MQRRLNRFLIHPIALPLTLARLAHSTMPPRKRAADDGEPPRRSSRRVSARQDAPKEEEPVKSSPPAKKPKVTATPKSNAAAAAPKAPKPKKAKAAPKAEEAEAPAKARAMSPDPPKSSIPRTNPDAPRHDGEWYWLMKAEPETRIENGVDVRFSIDDLRAKTEPEGWDGIRAYAGESPVYCHMSVK